MGLVGAAFGLGFVLGPALGGLLAHVAGRRRRCRSPPPGSPGSIWSSPSSGCASRCRAEVRGRSRRSPGSTCATSAGSAAPLRRPLPALLPGDVLLLDDGGDARPLLPGALRLRRRETSWLFVFVGVLLVVVQGGLIGRLVRRFGERALIRWPASSLMAVGPAAAAGVSRSSAVLLAALALLAIGYGLHNPSRLGLLSRARPTRPRRAARSACRARSAPSPARSGRPPAPGSSAPPARLAVLDRRRPDAGRPGSVGACAAPARQRRRPEPSRPAVLTRDFDYELPAASIAQAARAARREPPAGARPPGRRAPPARCATCRRCCGPATCWWSTTRG